MGGAAILLVTRGEPHWSAVFLLACIVMDGLDGGLARRFGVTSPFGAQMDSLADLCAFGVATPLLAYYWLETTTPTVAVALMSALLAACAMVRLARFNAMPKNGRYFSGLPAAMPTGIVAGGILLDLRPGVPYIVFAVMLSILMVTTLPYAKFGRLTALPWWVWPAGVAVAFINPATAFGLAIAGYLLSGPALWLRLRDEGTP